MNLPFKKTALAEVHGAAQSQLSHDPRLVRTSTPIQRFVALYRDAVRQIYCAVNEIDPLDDFTAWKMHVQSSQNHIEVTFSVLSPRSAFADFFSSFAAGAKASHQIDIVKTDTSFSLRAPGPEGLIRLLQVYLKRDSSGRGLVCLDDVNLLDDVPFSEDRFRDPDVVTEALRYSFRALPMQTFNSAAEAAYAAETLDGAGVLPFSVKALKAVIADPGQPFPAKLQAYRIH